MKQLVIVALALVAFWVSSAQAAEWENLTTNAIMNKDGAYSAVWLKEEEGQNCLLAITKTGQVGATIFRGSILKKDLDGQWHLAEYDAPSVQYVKERGLRVQNMYGSMPVGMEMLDLNAFQRQCDGLPPL